MPELPEVETVVCNLNEAIIGQSINVVECTKKQMRLAPGADFANIVLQTSIVRIWRRAKYIIIELQNQYCIVVHLGMSGRLFVADLVPFSAHNHLIIQLSSGNFLVFHDPRRFGFYTVMLLSVLPQHKIFQNLGLEPLSDAFNAEVMCNIAMKSRIAIKKLLMDGTKIVGIGNIYVSEALFLSGVRPERSASSLTRKECESIASNIKLILRRAISHGGSTLQDYRDGKGAKGKFQNHLLIYGKASQNCTRCDTLIQNVKIGGRSSYFCPRCQK